LFPSNGNAILANIGHAVSNFRSPEEPIMTQTIAVPAEAAATDRVALLDGVAPEGSELDEAVEELLVEEVSIDGMCGVY
jgi:mycofactocin precursor